jgi:MtN3 and saliva related transmembrane protein
MFDMLQLAGGAILALGYIPQIAQLARTRSCKDLNLKTYLSILAGVALMEPYAVNLVRHGSGHMFLITNSASLLILAVLCALIIHIKKAGSRHETR